MSSYEPILDLTKQRYTYFPIEYNNLHKLYVKQIDCFWRAEEIDLSQDSAAFDKLSSDEKFFIAHVLAFFRYVGLFSNGQLDGEFSQRSYYTRSKIILFIPVGYGIYPLIYIFFID